MQKLESAIVAAGIFVEFTFTFTFTSKSKAE